MWACPLHQLIIRLLSLGRTLTKDDRNKRYPGRSQLLPCERDITTSSILCGRVPCISVNETNKRYRSVVSYFLARLSRKMLIKKTCYSSSFCYFCFRSIIEVKTRHIHGTELCDTRPRSNRSIVAFFLKGFMQRCHGFVIFFNEDVINCTEECI